MDDAAAAAAGMESELLSRLPEDLIHQILGFLTTKEAVKVSFVCKSLQASWLSSRPSLDFYEQEDFKECELFHIHKYVFNTMSRVSFHKMYLRSFKLETYNFRGTETLAKLETETLDKWIGIALDGRVDEIKLYVVIQHYSLPARVLSSSFLKSLSLDCCNRTVSLGGGGAADVINLPCLQSLTLIRVCIDEESLQKLLKGCPSLEHLKIAPIAESLSHLNISHLKLKSLNASNRGCCLGKKILDKVEVEAPCLEEFSYTESSSSSSEDKTDIILKSSTSMSLKCLSLVLPTSISMEWLSKLLPNCTSLETLRIELWDCHEDTMEIFMISNPYIKNIVINYTCEAKFEIDCPVLNSLRWTAYVADGLSTRCVGCLSPLGLFPTLSMINHQLPSPKFAGHLHLDYKPYTDLNTEWFHKLREFLSTSRITAMSWLCRLYSHSKELVDHQNVDLESLPTSAVDIGLLYLMVRSGLPESCYSFIMNGFLSTCHPHSIHLATSQPEEEGKESIHFIEFFRKKLENWKDGDGCYCSSEIKCWKHQLKSVDIQEFSKLEDKLERDHYDFGILPKPPSFRLIFQWF